MQLQGHVAIVTGASRGVGKGVALALGSAGATVYVTGRTRRGAIPPELAALGGTIDDTAEEITARGGKGVAVAVDHADDAQVEALFAQIDAEAGRLDILVNNVFAIPAGEQYNTPFWKLPIATWDTMIDVGLRSHYVASVFAARRMSESSTEAGAAARRGIIVNISSFGAASYAVNVPYSVGKGALDRMSKDCARDLKPFGVPVVSLWPGIVRTERVMSGQFPYDTKISESAELTGRAVIALATDKDVMAKSGKAHVVAELAAEYGFTDVDGTTPPSLRPAAKPAAK